MKSVIIITIAIVFLFVPLSAFATGNIVVDSYCEDGVWYGVIQDQDGNPLPNANVYTMKGRSDIDQKFVTDENGIVSILNEDNLGLIKIVKSKFYDQTYPTKKCEIITPEIPSWVKNNAIWWADGQIDDDTFVTGIQFLIENSILKIPPTRVEDSQTDSKLKLPSWVKNNAKWWAEERVSESEFITSMQFLVKNNIIQIPEKKVILKMEQPSTTTKNTVSGDNLVFHKESLVIFLIYTTHNPSCSPSEVKMMDKYQQITEEFMKEQNVGRNVIVNEACLQMDEINANLYPLLLAQFNAMRPDLMIFVGDLTSNLDLYYEEEAYGVWGCMAFSSGMDCTTSVIVICECAPLFDDETDTNGGVWILSHELGHFLFNYKNYGANVYADAVHVVQYFYSQCLENGFTPECDQYYVTKEIDGESYNLMNLQLISSDYRAILAKIPSIEKELQKIDLKEFDIEIQGETILNPPDKQSIELTIYDGETLVDGAAVSANIIDSKGNIVNNFQAISQNNGKYLFSWNLGSDTKYGMYKVIISISHEDYISKNQFFSYTVE